MTKIFYLIFLYLILNFFCPGSRALTKNETYHLYFSSFLIHQVIRREVAGLLIHKCVFILSLTTKHKNLNLILVRSVLLTESSKFFFLRGGGGA